MGPVSVPGVVLDGSQSSGWMGGAFWPWSWPSLSPAEDFREVSSLPHFSEPSRAGLQGKLSKWERLKSKSRRCLTYQEDPTGHIRFRPYFPGSPMRTQGSFSYFFSFGLVVAIILRRDVTSALQSLLIKFSQVTTVFLAHRV